MVCMLSVVLLREELGKEIGKDGHMDSHINLMQGRQSACVGNSRPEISGFSCCMWSVHQWVIDRPTKEVKVLQP